jgi:DNA-binding winged helix-turn-helix (wHTH) protein
MALSQITSKARSDYQDLHLKLDFKRKFATLDSQPLVLTRKEHQLFSMLVENAGTTVSRHVLLTRVWGYRSEIRTHTLEVHIYRLRKMLGSYSTQYIESIFGTGYRFQPIAQERVDRSGIHLGICGALRIVQGQQSDGLVHGVTLRACGRRGWSLWRRSQDIACSDDQAGKLMRLVFQKQYCPDKTRSLWC